MIKKQHKFGLLIGAAGAAAFLSLFQSSSLVGQGDCLIVLLL